MTEPAPPGLTDRDCTLLVALADGELRGRQREEAEARVEALPDGRRLLERQRRARRALRAGLPAERPAFTPASRFEGWWRHLALTAVATALLLALVLAIPFSRSSLTTQAAELAVQPATEPAPRAAGPELQAAVDGVAFPNWGTEFGWHQSGARRDTLDGRATRTVYYEHMGHRIGYTIVAGPAVEAPSDARIVRRDGLEIALLRKDGRDIAIFERDGRTCVLAGHVEHTSTLVELASWRR